MAYFLDQKNPYRRRRAFQPLLPVAPVVVPEETVNRPYRWEFPITADWLPPTAYSVPSGDLDGTIFNDRRYDGTIASRLLGGWPRARDDLILRAPELGPAEAAELGADRGFAAKTPAIGYSGAGAHALVVPETGTVLVTAGKLPSKCGGGGASCSKWSAPSSLKWMLIALAVAIALVLLIR